MPLGLALGIAALVAIAAWRLRALTAAGALAATAVGGLVIWPTGWPGFWVLGAFFLSSTVVGRLGARRRPEDADREIRDARQVVANGGGAAALAPLEWAAPGLGLWLATAALAAAASDTWATALGSLSRRPPRDILKGTVVAPGTSGGVTWPGTLGGLAGAALVAVAGALTDASEQAWRLPAAAAIGFAGMLVDSALGSGAQARFHCPACDRPTERRVHRCGTRTSHRKGWAWLDNDGVNAFATLVAAALGWLAWRWLA